MACSGSEREQADARRSFFDNDEAARGQSLLVRASNGDHKGANVLRQYTLCAYLDHARAGCMRERKRRSKTEIMREHDSAVGPGPIHDDGIFCLRVTNR